MPKFPPNANFSMDNPLKKLASTSNLKSSALMKEKEWVHDYELKNPGQKPPPGTRINARIHQVDKKTTNNPVKTDPSGRYMTPNTNFTTKKKVDFTKGAPKKTTPKSKPIDFKNDKAPKTNYKTKFVDDSKTKEKKKGTKKKVTFKEAYKKRNMKTYGNLSFDEYKAEAKRQIKSKASGKGYDAPKSQMKGTATGPKTKPTTKKVTEKIKTAIKPDPKKFETVESAKTKRKAAKKAVKTARKEFGRGSDEVKVAKTKRKAATQKVKEVKKGDIIYESNYVLEHTTTAQRIKATLYDFTIESSPITRNLNILSNAVFLELLSPVATCE